MAVPAYGAAAGPVGAAEAFDERAQEARERIESLGGFEAHAAYRDPVEELAVYSASFDLLIVGSRGYGQLGTLVHGSTSQHLARRTMPAARAHAHGAHPGDRRPRRCS